MSKNRPQPNGNSIHVESRAFTSRAQLQDALTAFGSVGAFLRSFDMPDMDGKVHELDGSLKCAVEATMINICSRIDCLMADKERWTMDARNTLEKTLTNSYEASAELFKHQAAIAKEATTPHATMSPMLVRLFPGVWMAIKGSVNNIEASIIGIGHSPAAALECFDDAFNGKLTPEKTKQIERLLDEAKMDRAGSGTTEATEGSGSDDAGDSEANGQNLQVGGAQDNQPDKPTGLILPGDEGFNADDLPPVT